LALPDKVEKDLVWLDAGTYIMVALVTVAMLAAVIYQFHTASYEWAQHCLAVLLGPVGALARWQLARLHTVPQGAEVNRCVCSVMCPTHAC
jgi:hypothetical protein